MRPQFNYPIQYRYFSDILFIYIVIPLIMVPVVGLFLGIFAAPFYFHGWITVERYECAFEVIYILCIVWWIFARFIYPRYWLLQRQHQPITTQEQTSFVKYLSSAPMFNVMFASIFLWIFFYYLLGEYFFHDGTFFGTNKPQSIWGVIGSGINALTGNYLSEFVKGTELNGVFNSYNSGRFSHKIIVKATQVTIVIGLIKSVIAVVKLQDSAYGIRLDSYLKNSDEEKT